ncbi:MAG: sugar ABC transporter substrate-binding protein [Actinobacteria bacterium]|nr:sugar ABC transporter substrate-binding protein [Actinomycetota bacterium]
MSPVAAEPDQQGIMHGMEEASGELGWSASLLDAALSADKQVSLVETAINRGDAAIASWTLDPNVVGGAYEKAKQAGLPLIGVNSAGQDVTTSVWYEFQRCEPGGPQAQTAKRMNEINPGAKVIVIGYFDAESTKELSDCFEKEAKAAGLEVINATQNEADTASGSQRVFEPLLTKYPEVEAVWCYNDESALGVGAALLASGEQIASKPGDEGVVVTGLDGDPTGVEAVKEGRMSWTWDANTVATGIATVGAMKEALDTGKAKEVVIESELLDSETIGSYVKPEDRGYTLESLPIKK